MGRERTSSAKLSAGPRTTSNEENGSISRKYSGNETEESSRLRKLSMRYETYSGDFIGRRLTTILNGIRNLPEDEAHEEGNPWKDGQHSGIKRPTRRSCFLALLNMSLGLKMIFIVGIPCVAVLVYAGISFHETTEERRDIAHDDQLIQCVRLMETCTRIVSEEIVRMVEWKVNLGNSSRERVLSLYALADEYCDGAFLPGQKCSVEKIPKFYPDPQLDTFQDYYRNVLPVHRSTLLSMNCTDHDIAAAMGFYHSLGHASSAVIQKLALQATSGKRKQLILYLTQLIRAEQHISEHLSYGVFMAYNPMNLSEYEFDRFHHIGGMMIASIGVVNDIQLHRNLMDDYSQRRLSDLTYEYEDFVGGCNCLENIIIDVAASWQTSLLPMNETLHNKESLYVNGSIVWTVYSQLQQFPIKNYEATIASDESSALNDVLAELVAAFAVLAGSIPIAFVVGRSVSASQSTKQNEVERRRRLEKAMFRFFPRQYQELLGVRNVLDLKPGQRKSLKLTIFFADIRNFTTVSEKLGPEKTYAWLVDYLKAIGPIISKYDGFIERTLGDGILAMFKQPLEALNAAIEIQQTADGLNRRMGDDFAQNSKAFCRYEVGIGVHVGEVVVGIIGSKDRMEGAIISEAVRVAMTLEEYSKKYGCRIVASQDVMSCASISTHKSILSRSLGRIPVDDYFENGTNVYDVYNGDNRTSVIFKTATKHLFENLTAADHTIQELEQQSEYARMQTIAKEYKVSYKSSIADVDYAVQALHVRATDYQQVQKRILEGQHSASEMAKRVEKFRSASFCTEGSSSPGSDSPRAEEQAVEETATSSSKSVISTSSTHHTDSPPTSGIANVPSCESEARGEAPVITLENVEPESVRVRIVDNKETANADDISDYSD